MAENLLFFFEDESSNNNNNHIHHNSNNNANINLNYHLNHQNINNNNIYDSNNNRERKLPPTKRRQSSSSASTSLLYPNLFSQGPVQQVPFQQVLPSSSSSSSSSLRFYAIRKCHNLDAPAIFCCWKDCSIYVDEDNHDTDTETIVDPEFQVFDNLFKAVEYINSYYNIILQQQQEQQQQQQLQQLQQQQLQQQQQQQQQMSILEGQKINRMSVGGHQQQSVTAAAAAAAMMIPPSTMNQRKRIAQNNAWLNDFPSTTTTLTTTATATTTGAAAVGATGATGGLQRQQQQEGYQHSNRKKLPTASTGLGESMDKMASISDKTKTVVNGGRKSLGFNDMLTTMNKRQGQQEQEREQHLQENSNSTTMQEMTEQRRRQHRQEQEEGHHTSEKIGHSRRNVAAPKVRTTAATRTTVAVRTATTARIADEQQDSEERNFENMFQLYQETVAAGKAIKTNPQLVSWVSKQRKEYNAFRENEPNTTMTADRFTRMTTAGFSFEPRKTQSWEERAAQWYESQKKLLKDPTLRQEKSIAKWETKQRAKYHQKEAGGKTNLTEEQIRTLTEWGFQWDFKIIQPKRTRERISWEDRVAELETFKKIHGHGLVPLDLPGLGHWIRGQRKQYRKFLRGQTSTMTGERLARLTAAGLEFHSYRARLKQQNAEKVQQQQEEQKSRRKRGQQKRHSQQQPQPQQRKRTKQEQSKRLQQGADSSDDDFDSESEAEEGATDSSTYVDKAVANDGGQDVGEKQQEQVQHQMMSDDGSMAATSSHIHRDLDSRNDASNHDDTATTHSKEKQQDEEEQQSTELNSPEDILTLQF